MGSVEMLVERLEQAGRDGWEDEYVRVRVEISRAQAIEIVESARSFSAWFALRFDAGPPGRALPAMEDALQALLVGTDGTALDAYCVLLSGPVLRADAPSELILALLCNGAACALKSGQTWLATWLVERAGIAAVALGRPEIAWCFLDGLTREGERHPNLDRLATLLPLRGVRELEHSVWVRRVLRSIWPQLGVLAVLQLPIWSLELGHECSFAETIDALTKVGANHVRDLLEAVLGMAKDAETHQRERESARELLVAVKQAASRLGEKGRLGRADLERAVEEVRRAGGDRMSVSLAMMERGLSLLERLVLALVVRGVVSRSGDVVLVAGVTKVASDALSELRELQLFPLRLELLDELIALRSPEQLLSQLYFERANTRRAMAPEQERERELALADFATAMGLAWEEQDGQGIAHATSAWAKCVVGRDVLAPERLAASYAGVEAAITRALGLEHKPFERAVLMQARAHLVRTHDLDEGISLTKQALALVATDHRFWPELAAEVVAMLVVAQKEREAISTGRELLKQARAIGAQIELAMLELNVGEALLRVGEWLEAREHLESALEQARGRAPHMEARARIFLVIGGKASDSQGLVDEHYSFLCEHARELDPATRMELDNLHRVMAVKMPSDAELSGVARVAPTNRTSRDQEVFLHLLKDPIGAHFLSVRIRMMAPEETWATPQMQGMSAEEQARFEKEMAERSIHGKVDEIEALLTSLEGQRSTWRRVSALAGKVVVLAALVRMGRRSVAEVRVATEVALRACELVNDLLVRSLLVREIAMMWAPRDHVADPLRDFPLAVRLLRECMRWEGGEETAVSDTVSFLARALRYSNEGDLAENLRESRRLYQVWETKADEIDGPDLRSNRIANLAEAEAQMGTGNRAVRLQVAVEDYREAVRLARSPHRRAQETGNLAWTLTQLAVLSSGDVRREGLREALAVFARVEVAALDESGRSNVEDNRTTCAASLARVEQGRVAEILIWRKRLREVNASAHPERLATVKHNLANALFFGEGITRAELAEALVISTEAWEVRARGHNLRHRWETAVNVGLALTGPLVNGESHLLPYSVDASVAEARTWLRRAIEAARGLGPGEELAQASFALAELASFERKASAISERAEEAWRSVRLAAPYLLFDRQSREQEARLALRIAAALADSFAEEALLVEAAGLGFVLQGEAAEQVARWMIRGQQPARRPVVARLARPKAVAAAQWEEWKRALDSGEQRRIADELEKLRVGAPSFLQEDVVGESMWRWLAARTGSVGVTLLVAPEMSFALVMRVTPEGARRSWVLGLEVDPSEAGAIRRVTAEGIAAPKLEEIGSWIRRSAIAPILRFLGEPPSTVLWNPLGGVRSAPPAEVWGAVPVATVSSLALPDLAEAPGRRASTLLVMADPGDLKEHGSAALSRLAVESRRRGSIEVLVSCGAAYGPSVLRDLAGVREAPASARRVLAEAVNHDTVVLLGHGCYEEAEPGNSTFFCVNEHGADEYLNVAMLASHPLSFFGATVLLLACSGGRIAEHMVDPGGIAGALLSAGARCVVAPLSPVRVDVAEQLGVEVLGGLREGLESWEALARAQAVLGMQIEDEALRAELRSFVAWIG